MLTKLLIVGALVIVCAIIALCYRKIGPGETLVVYGLGSLMKIVSGPRGLFVLPLFQKGLILSREIFTVKFEASEVFVKSGVNVTVSGTARVRLRDDEESLRKAARNLLSANFRDKLLLVNSIIDEASRRAFKDLEPMRLIEDVNGCAAQVKDRATSELERLGYELQSLTISDVKDRMGYLSTLSRRITAEEKARLAIEEAYITREGRAISMLIKRDAQMKSIGLSIEESKEKKLDMDKVRQNTEEYFRIMKERLKKGIKDASDHLYTPEKHEEKES
ncbi:MAG: flotillin family protein [Candidatus Eremiobacteraeota bacterium]|nr:flotillin family protein [Candidatus Eremiobacteraeota bacterium]